MEGLAKELEIIMKKSPDFIQTRRKMLIGSQKTGARISL